MNAILVPGRPDRHEHYDSKRPSNSEDHWFGWLKRQLILRDIHAVSIEPPFPFRPRYDEWKKEFERFEIESDTILVGHSCGGGFLVRYLSEHPGLQVGKVALVAPWINPDNDPMSDVADFFEFKIDPGFPSHTQGTVIFVSDNDYASVRKTVDVLQNTVHGLEIRRLSDRGHFTLHDLGTVEFPQLLEVLTSDKPVQA